MEKRVFTYIVAHNQPIVAAGIQTFLSGRNELRCSGHIRAAENLMENVLEIKPDLLVTDHCIPGFITLDDLASIFRKTRGLNVLLISSETDRSVIHEAIGLGVKGFISHDCSKEELILAAEASARGEKFFSSRILDAIIQQPNRDKLEEISVLTSREREILKLLAQGKSTQKIADDLYLSPHTVQTHRKSIIRKLNIKSPTQFVIFALDMGLIRQK